ncbi:uncharacterized protein LOC114261454 isoform X2 [Camellia sinensis]|uniref:uncharacterized protein LOC114261454 isoform X2 n=1 Tax=Camellia sinensis TaxID=4442 RepID=UPI0010361D33|nr:uncharacterized protein LOC114261454 isoform X2 [Camellia sinensis]
MDTIDELAQLADSMRQASALLADKDVNENSSSSRRPSTFLNVVALVNTGIICLTSCSSTTPIAIVVALLALPVATATSSLSGNRRIFSSRRFGYLASARCSSSGVLVLVEPVSTVNGGDQHLATPKTERCSNCSGSGKVNHALGF